MGAGPRRAVYPDFDFGRGKIGWTALIPSSGVSPKRQTNVATEAEIEAAARAAWESFHAPYLATGGWGDESHTQRSIWRSVARAALEAAESVRALKPGGPG